MDNIDIEVTAQDNINIEITGVPGTFISLLDTPASYGGQALKGVRVNAGGTALEFFSLAAGGITDANNGLGVLGTVAQLGGALIKNTSITGAFNFTLNIGGDLILESASSVSVGSTGDITTLKSGDVMEIDSANGIDILNAIGAVTNPVSFLAMTGLTSGGVRAVSQQSVLNLVPRGYQMLVENPTASESLPFFTPDLDVTIDKVVAFTRPASTTVTMQLNRRVSTTPNTSGTNMLTSPLVADDNTETTVAFADPDVDAQDHVELTTSAIGGVPTELKVMVYFKQVA